MGEFEEGCEDVDFGSVGFLWRWSWIGSLKHIFKVGR